LTLTVAVKAGPELAFLTEPERAVGAPREAPLPVGRDGDGHDVVRVPAHRPQAASHGQVPEPERAVLAPREAPPPVGRDGDGPDRARVPGERPDRPRVLVILPGEPEYAAEVAEDDERDQFRQAELEARADEARFVGRAGVLHAPIVGARAGKVKRNPYFTTETQRTQRTQRKTYANKIYDASPKTTKWLSF